MMRVKDFTELLSTTNPNRVKRGTWESVENRKIYAKWLGERLRFESANDWYQITKQKMTDLHGGGLLVGHYNGSPSQFVMAMFPEYHLKPYKFAPAPQGYWKSEENQKSYAYDLGVHLGYKKKEDWYQLTQQKTIDFYGSGLLDRYGYSPSDFIMAVFPEYHLKPYKFSSPKGYWENKENQKSYAYDLGVHLGYKKKEDWYQLTGQQMKDFHGGGLLASHYNGSPSQFVMAVFPEYHLKPYKFAHAPQGYWKSEENQKSYAYDLGVHLGYKKREDWYQLTGQQMIDFHGGGLLSNPYNDSPSQFVMAMFPEYHLKPYKFSSPKGYWENKESQKSYAYDLGVQLGYKKKEDWYQLTLQQMTDFHGGGLLGCHYNGSPSKFVMAMFPEYHLKHYKFGQCLNGYWKNKENHKSYVHDLGVYLGYKKSEDWYQITKQQIFDFHGGGLLHYYNSSPSKFVMAMFPEYHLELSKFRKNYSQGQIQWLNYMCVETPDVRHILNHEDGEYRIPNSRYHADGYSVSNNKLYEYDGDFYHGNPKIHNQDDMNRRTKTTYGELYEKTLKKKQFCEDSGYNVISIWESEWIRAKLTVIKLQQKWKNRNH